MPYGSGGDRLDDILIVRGVDGHPPNYTYGPDGIHPKNRLWSRQGNNYTGSISDILSQKSYTIKKVRKLVFNGPRLAFKVWSTKKGRMVWARKPIEVTRYIKVPSKRSKTRYLDLPPNYLSFTELKINYFGRRAYTHEDWMGWSYYGDLWRNFPLMDGWNAAHGYNEQSMTSSGFQHPDMSSTVAELDDQVLTALYSKVKNQSVNLGNVFAERAETARMLIDAVKNLARAISALRKGNVLAAASMIFPTNGKNLANSWLLAQYGILPLLSDIDGMAKHLATPESVYFDIVVKRKKELPLTQTLDATSKYLISVRDQVWVKGEVEVKLAARYRISIPALRELDRLGLTNLWSVLWEVTPYSFVVDWILPVGNFLNTFDQPHGLELVHAHKTITRKETVDLVCEFGGRDNEGRLWSPATSGLHKEIVKVQRYPLTSIPPIPWPRFKNPVSGYHVANAIALIRQLL